MNRDEAEKYINILTQDEKFLLNEMLKDLEQKRQLSPIPCFAIVLVGERNVMVVNAFNDLNDIFMKCMEMILKLSPSVYSACCVP